MPTRVRVAQWDGKHWLSKDDLLLMFSKYGESPTLGEDERRVVEVMIRMIRNAEFSDDEEKHG